MRNLISNAAWAAILLVSVAAPGLARAQTGAPPDRAQQEAACRTDAFKFCEMDIPDSSRVEACLRRNKARISQACQALLK